MFVGIAQAWKATRTIFWIAVLVLGVLVITTIYGAITP